MKKNLLITLVCSLFVVFQAFSVSASNYVALHSSIVIDEEYIGVIADDPMSAALNNVKVYDAETQNMVYQVNTPAPDYHQIDVSSWNSGNYWVKVKCNGCSASWYQVNVH